jgi:hypothetical protein
MDPSEEETAPLPIAATSRPRGPRIAAISALAIVAAVLVAIIAGVLLSGGDDDAPATRVTIPAPEATDTPEPEATGEKTAEPTPRAAERTVVEDGYTWARPGSGWHVGGRVSASGGARVVRRLGGPDGALITIVHTPGEPAQPAASTVESEDPFTAPGVTDARKLVLANFPTDECQDRECDDFVLNDPSFGGLAILASDSGGPASKAAARVARSVRTDT